jgi:hypothetical protein
VSEFKLHALTRIWRRGEYDYYTPVYPVGDVQSTVCAQRGEVVRRDRFCFAGALEDEKLREDGDGLEEDGESPKDLCDGVGIVEDDSEEECGEEEVLDAEGVDGRVICWSVIRAVQVKIAAERSKDGKHTGNGIS